MDLRVFRGPATRLVRLVCSPGLDLFCSYTNLDEVFGTAVIPKPKVGIGKFASGVPPMYIFPR
jgi:hypothetical protein